MRFSSLLFVFICLHVYCCYSATHVRLAGGQTPLAGRVEIYYKGAWGTVCGDGFDESDADVVCRMLGYNKTTNATVFSGAYFGEGSGAIVISNLRCQGYESDVKDCVSDPWLQHNCSHSNDVGVSCHTKIRLVGDATPDKGYIEVFANGQWISICRNGFDTEDADVVCRTLGYSNRNGYYKFSALYTSSSSRPVTITNLTCTGNEHDLSECASNSWGSYTGCSRYDAVSLKCPDTSVRLVDGPNKYSGRIELAYHYVWQTVCDDNGTFGVDDGNVVCRMLKDITFLGTSSVKPNHYYGEGKFHPVVKDLQCSGQESDISLCRSSDWWNKDRGYLCDKHYDVGVDCSTHIRLTNGRTPYDGHLEILYHGEWSSVCINNFHHNDAEVACKSLGFRNSNVSYWYGLYDAKTRQTLGVVGAGCDGSEADIAECGLNITSCPDYREVVIECEKLSETPIRLVGGVNELNGRVEVNYDGEWGTVCGDFHRPDADVICRIMRNETHSNSSGYYIDYGYYGSAAPEVLIPGLYCDGTESDISKCPSKPWHPNGGHCNNNDVAVDCRTRVRLVDGWGWQSGRVEIYSGGEWGTVCDDNFDKNDAIVLCKMMGYYYSDSLVFYHGNAYYGQGEGPIIVDELQCNGDEIDIIRCNSSSWFHSDCTHSEDVSIDCRGIHTTVRTTPSPPPATTTPTTTRKTTTSWPKTPLTTTQVYSMESAVRVSCNEYGWDISIDMYMLKTIYPGAVASDIYLGENTCTGLYNGQTISFQQGLRECLTSETVNHNILVYNNELVYAQRDPNHPFIIRHYNWTVGVECDVQRNETSSGHLHHATVSSTSYHVNGSNHYVVNMTFYRDANYLYPIQGNPVQAQVGTQVYVKVFTTTTDWTIKMKVHTCYTKPTPSSSEHLNFNLIKDGCEVDSNTHIISQSSHETRFVFKDFEYTSNHEGIYLYCDATFCGSSDYSRQCLQTCNPVVRK